MSYKELLDLMEIVEEQQVLIKLLLELYPESPQKEEIHESARRIRNKTQSAKSQLTFLARSEE